MNVDDVLFALACRTLAEQIEETSSEMGEDRAIVIAATISHMAFQAGLELAVRDPQRAATYRLRLFDVGGSEGIDSLVDLFAEAVS